MEFIRSVTGVYMTLSGSSVQILNRSFSYYIFHNPYSDCRFHILQNETSSIFSAELNAGVMCLPPNGFARGRLLKKVLNSIYSSGISNYHTRSYINVHEELRITNLYNPSNMNTNLTALTEH
jgi:hypothetical protein